MLLTWAITSACCLLHNAFAGAHCCLSFFMMNFYLKSIKLKINLAEMYINFVWDYLTILFAFPQNCSEILLQDAALLKYSVKKFKVNQLKGRTSSRAALQTEFPSYICFFLLHKYLVWFWLDLLLVSVFFRLKEYLSVKAVIYSHKVYKYFTRSHVWVSLNICKNICSCLMPWQIFAILHFSLE